jgi:hypothetical protein
MKPIRRTFKTILLTVALHASFAPTSPAAVDPAYNDNDLLFFGLKRSGSAWIDNIVTFSLGSTWNVIRRAATPGDPTFGTVIFLGNINSILNSSFSTDWTGLTTDTLYFGAAGQNGSTSGLSSAVDNGDYARTSYITSPRAGAGTLGQANSTPKNIPTANAGGTAGNINGANSVALGRPNPFSTNATGEILIDNYNPLTPSETPGTAYGSINGGIIGTASSSTYNYGTVSNIVLGLDVYRVTPNLGNGTSGGPAWQNLHGITADYGGTGGNGWAYFLGTITLSANGDVNFVAKSGAANPYDTWATGFGLSGTNALGTSDPDGDRLVNNREFSFGTDPTVGSPALATTAKTGNQVSVTFLRRADLTYAVQKRASLNSGSFATDPGISPTNVVPQGTVPPGYTKVAFSVTATNNQFFQILATQP